MKNRQIRVVIENVQPCVDNGRFPVKRVVGEKVGVSADVFSDGHDILSAAVVYSGPEGSVGRSVPLRHVVNDRWQGSFPLEAVGIYRFSVAGWVNHFLTWKHDLKKRIVAAQDPAIQLIIGARIVEAAAERAAGEDQRRLTEIAVLLGSGKPAEKTVALALGDDLTELMELYPDMAFAAKHPVEFQVLVERKKALFSSWYERFPRSTALKPEVHGSLRDCIRLLPEVAKMGFDTWYLPPIHPIGTTNRKGKNNSEKCEPEDVGSPWAIGSKEGGHKAIHPDLGTLGDFGELVKAAEGHGLEIALDLAFQCSPDHPYIKDHPQWFKWRPDGTIQYAENPPKKYQDIVPFDFETSDAEGLWEELKSVVIFWAERGVRIFRVDNPHTKPFRFWEWLIRGTRMVYPDLIFLAEAFARPKIMLRLAKVGFSQSYTYFTWRNTRAELISYIENLVDTETAEFFRPNFWPNTPDILPEILQVGGRRAFISRLILAATLSSNYGIYGPQYELCVADAIPGTEEYLDSEKYEIRQADWDFPGNIKSVIARVNDIRKDNPALQRTRNLRFLPVDNEFLLAYVKSDEAAENFLLIVVNLDLHRTQSGWIEVPIDELGLEEDRSYLVHELMGDDKFFWSGRRNYVRLDPEVFPAHIFRVRRFMKREGDFDYFM